MAECIVLKGGSGADLDVITAEDPDVLTGKVIVDKDGNPLPGTMANNGAVSQALNAGGSYTVPAGYHNGSGKVTANSLTSQTVGTATAARIANGDIAWSNGVKIPGTMPMYGGTYWNNSLGIGLESDNLYSFFPVGHYDQFDSRGSLHRIPIARLQSAVGASAEKIKEGTSIAGISGTMKDYSYLATGQVSF